jgi:excinuclease UvrABC ATPase subunit
MSGTAFKCGHCDGQGVLLINISSDGESPSYVEKPCPVCNGERLLTKAQLMTMPADNTLEASEFLPIPMTGAFRAYVEGKLFERKMTARQLYKLAHYALTVAIETEKYERESNEIQR